MSSTGGLSSNDPSAIEREGDEIRADMSATLDALGRKLSPGEIMDQSLNLLKNHGGEFAGSLGERVRRNPLPFALTAAGLIWLVASQRSSRDTLHYQGYDAGSSVDADWDMPPGYTTTGKSEDIAGASAWSDTHLSGGDGSSASHGGFKQRIKGAASHLKDRVQGGTNAARQKLQSSRQRLRSTTEHVRSGREATMNRMSSAVQSTRMHAQRARQDFSTLIDERPLALGAIGIVIGALIGAALPSSRREDEMFGQARDRALQRTKEMGSERYTEVRQRTMTAAQRAREAALQSFKSGEEGSAHSDSSLGSMGSTREEGSFRGESGPIGRA